MSRTKIKCNGARQRSHVRMNRYTQSLSRVTRGDAGYRRIIPLPPIADSQVTDVELFVTTTCDLPEPESDLRPKLSLRERAAAAVVKSLEALPVVNNWSIGPHPLALDNPDALTARGVDQDALCVYGWVNCDCFRSSPVTDVRLTSVGVVVRTFKGHRYRLGSPDPDFQAWCREHNFAMPTAEHRWQR